MEQDCDSQESLGLEQTSQVTISEQKEEECCFGMITGLPMIVTNPDLVYQTPLPLRISRDSCMLFNPAAQSVFGNMDRYNRKILDVLQRELSLQAFADDPSIQAQGGNLRGHEKARRGKPRSRLELCIILYGPSTAFENVGMFTAQCNLFLQHPKYCDRNVLYANPQCLSPRLSQPVYTYDLAGGPTLGNSQAEAIANPIDLFTDTTGQELLKETDSPIDLHTNLYKHQKQALTFMMQREEGWSLAGHHRDIWAKEEDPEGRITYVNTITNTRQNKPPPNFRGGLLIDAPGLGKSLSIIALIAADRQKMNRKNCEEAASQTTLLVVPKTLIQTWTDELQKHLLSTSPIRHCVYYGKNRGKHLERTRDYALIITTYSIIRIDWKASLSNSDAGPNLFTERWGRLVLDEAHVIREPSKSFAKSVCALQTEKRWAVTGTPIQNRLMDLFSLFKFLKPSPFDDLSVFNAEVSEKWKARSDPESVAKLKTLVNCLSLRRPKATIELPPREDKVAYIDFSESEWEHYDRVRNGTRHRLDSVHQFKRGFGFRNVLAWVNELRLLCNCGLANSHAMRLTDFGTTPEMTWNQSEAQRSFDLLEDAGLATCTNQGCRQDLSSVATDEDHCDEPSISHTLELLCSLCTKQEGAGIARLLKVCNHVPRQSEVATAVGATESHELMDGKFSLAQGQALVATGYTPSKIRQVLKDLEGSASNIKSVVFSAWTTTFNILQPHLLAKSIRCVRLDGSLSSTGRANVLRVFRADPDIRVLLATISCGGIGLDLTAASRAYIMEPQWNPMSESQALDRIHRLGQREPVVTTRYVMRRSFEQNVLTLQRRKQELADIALCSGAIRKSDFTYGRLQYLKQLIG